MRLFVKTDEKLILFNSYAGRKYDDSPKAIFDVMKNDPRFEGYKLVWAFHDPEVYDVAGAEKIKTDTFAGGHCRQKYGLQTPAWKEVCILKIRILCTLIPGMELRSKKWELIL